MLHCPEPSRQGTVDLRSLVSELNWNKYITTVVHNDRKEVVELD